MLVYVLRSISKLRRQMSSRALSYRSAWPRCLACYGWLPALPPRRAHPSWAAAEVDSVDAALENGLVAYPMHLAGVWRPGWDPEDIIDLAEDVPANPNISGMKTWMRWLGVAGSGAFDRSVNWVFDDRV